MRQQDYLVGEEETLDDLVLGSLKIIQPRKGYRFSIDAVLLAHFPEMDGVETVVDLGMGNGVMALLLAYRNPQASITGVEIQKQMVQRARRSVLYNHLEQRITITQADINRIPDCWSAGQADLVVANPPFWKKGQGQVSQDPEQAIARHELQVNLSGVVRAARHLLKPGGRFALLQPARRLSEALYEFHQQGLSPQRLRLIHPLANREAGHFLLEAVPLCSSPLRILPPLVIYQSPGIYGEEIRLLYREPQREGNRHHE